MPVGCRLVGPGRWASSPSSLSKWTIPTRVNKRLCKWQWRRVTLDLPAGPLWFASCSLAHTHFFCRWIGLPQLFDILGWVSRHLQSATVASQYCPRVCCSLLPSLTQFALSGIFRSCCLSIQQCAKRDYNMNWLPFMCIINSTSLP